MHMPTHSRTDTWNIICGRRTQSKLQPDISMASSANPERLAVFSQLSTALTERNCCLENVLFVKRQRVASCLQKGNNDPYLTRNWKGGISWRIQDKQTKIVVLEKLRWNPSNTFTYDKQRCKISWQNRTRERGEGRGERGGRRKRYLSSDSHLPAEGPEQKRPAGQEPAEIAVYGSHWASGSYGAPWYQMGPGSGAQASPSPPLPGLGHKS